MPVTCDVKSFFVIVVLNVANQCVIVGFKHNIRQNQHLNVGYSHKHKIDHFAVFYFILFCPSILSSLDGFGYKWII